MSDQTSDGEMKAGLPARLPAPDPTSQPEQAAPQKPLPEAEEKPVAAAKPRRSTWPYWLAAGFLILLGGEAYLLVQQLAHQADKTQLAVLEVEVNDLRTNAAKTSPVADLIAAQAQLAQKQAALSAQITAVQGQVVADHTTLAALQVNAQEISQLTTRMAQLNAVAAARMALEAGQPLGVIPHAPPALTLFADTAPPTLLQLKADFPAVARNAEAASLTSSDTTGFWNKVKVRLEGLITVSNGQHVIFGPPAAATLNIMRVALANDDLASAVAAAETLNAPTQAAMASWLTPARQLLAAQQALLSMTQQKG